MQHVEPDSLVPTKNSSGLSKCSKTEFFGQIHLALLYLTCKEYMLGMLPNCSQALPGARPASPSVPRGLRTSHAALGCRGGGVRRLPGGIMVLA